MTPPAPRSSRTTITVDITKYIFGAIATLFGIVLAMTGYWVKNTDQKVDRELAELRKENRNLRDRLLTVELLKVDLEVFERAVDHGRTLTTVVENHKDNHAIHSGGQTFIVEVNGKDGEPSDLFFHEVKP